MQIETKGHHAAYLVLPHLAKIGCREARPQPLCLRRIKRNPVQAHAHVAAGESGNTFCDRDWTNTPSAPCPVVRHG